jgi:hypothetical protein
MKRDTQRSAMGRVPRARRARNVTRLARKRFPPAAMKYRICGIGDAGGPSGASMGVAYPLTLDAVEDIIIMNMFIYESRVEIRAGRDRVWPLLCGAAMTLPPPLLFRLGIPRPVECRLGEDGQTRECVTDRGRVSQRILERRPPELLAFERVADTAGLEFWLHAMKDTFLLEETPEGMILTRRTEVDPRGCAGPLLRLAMPLIHHYVHRNMKALAESGPSAEGSRPPAGHPRR